MTEAKTLTGTLDYVNGWLCVRDNAGRLWPVAPSSADSLYFILGSRWHGRAVRHVGGLTWCETVGVGTYQTHAEPLTAPAGQESGVRSQKKTSVYLGEETRRQMTALSVRFGSMANIIRVAVDRLFQSLNV